MLGGMKWNSFFTLLTAAALLAGCSQSAPPAAAAAPSPDPDDAPTAAQPKLPTIKLWVGPQAMTAEMALTQKEEQTGMMFRTNMGEMEGMIFVFDRPQQASFWMKNCPLPLSCAYMDIDGRILEIHELHSQDTNLVVSAARNIMFVLETPSGWFDRHNIQPGTIVASEKGSLKNTFLEK
jgi:uncharacterized membrane protein (UPF0127 family)